MKTLIRKTETLLISLPFTDKAPYIKKIKKYSSECGCSLGAKFLVAAIILFSIYIIKFANFASTHLFKQFLYGGLFIFIVSITGKLIGIGIARIKLFLLYRSLLKSHNSKNIAYVNMHPLG